MVLAEIIMCARTLHHSVKTPLGLVFRTENDLYTEFESLKLEWGYGKWWCNTDWCVCCGTECGTLCDVELDEVKRGL